VTRVSFIGHSQGRAGRRFRQPAVGRVRPRPSGQFVLRRGDHHPRRV